MQPGVAMMEKRALVLNSHEAWVAQLGRMPFEMDVVVGLSGRHHGGWDERMRPVPANARLIDLATARRQESSYGVAIGHNLTDLFELKDLELPKLLVLHTTLEGRLAEQGGGLDLSRLSQETRRYLKLIRAHSLAVSPMKKASWDLPADVVGSCVSVDDYPPPSQELAQGLRIVNHLNRRRHILKADFCDAAFLGISVKIVGHNDDIPGVVAARNWADLKSTIQASRFFIHTAEPGLEDGFNMAMAEAMAGGLAVLGNRHPTSVVEHGVTGYLSDDPAELNEHANRLLQDRQLSLKMGLAAREQARELFHPDRFVSGIARSVKRCRQKFFARGTKTSPRRRKKR